MTPIYIENFTPSSVTPILISDVPWKRYTETRQECFMAVEPTTYTYGRGPGERTYTSVLPIPEVQTLLNQVNAWLATSTDWGKMNVVFLNLYENERQHLGWHADDHEGTDHTRPIVVLSFGAPREICWRKTSKANGLPFPGEVSRQILASGSLFIMPPGFQTDYQHRIPKCSRSCGPRASLTFRAFTEST